MKICKKCNSKLPLDANFCMSCGGQDFEELVDDINHYESWTAEKIDEENSKLHTNDFYIDNFLSKIKLDPNIKEILETVVRKLLTFTKIVAGKIVQLGKIILEWIVNSVMEAIPYVLFGFAAGFLLGLIISKAIPIVGDFLTGVIIPICTKLGGIAGFVIYCKDKIDNPELTEKLKSMLSVFTGKPAVEFA